MQDPIHHTFTSAAPAPGQTVLHTKAGPFRIKGGTLQLGHIDPRTFISNLRVLVRQGESIEDYEKNVQHIWSSHPTAVAGDDDPLYRFSRQYHPDSPLPFTCYLV